MALEQLEAVLKHCVAGIVGNLHLPLVSLVLIARVAFGAQAPHHREYDVVHDQIHVKDIRPETGHAYWITLPPTFLGWLDDAQQRGASRLVVLENGVALGPPHSKHEEIRRHGSGRYSHWGGGVLFSSSDNTDPRANERRYSIGFARVSERSFFDPVTSEPPSVEEVFDRPLLTLTSDGVHLRDGKIQLAVVEPIDSLRYYWEVDVEPTFDSDSLHRQPLLGLSAHGPDPLTILNREADLRDRLDMPYRIGALAVPPQDLANDSVDLLAMRLGFRLDAQAKIREVYEFVSHQFYPRDTSNDVRTARETVSVDRGLCRNVNALSASLLDSLGFATRLLQVSTEAAPSRTGRPSKSHVTCEVFSGGHWSIVDPWMEVWLPMISMQSVAEGRGPGSMVVLKDRSPSSKSDGPGLSRESTHSVTLMDYASSRSYFRGFDGRHLIVPESPELEQRLFAGGQRFVPDWPFDALWPEPVIDVWIRVRGLQVSEDQLAHRFFGQGPAKRPETVVGTPWTTIVARIDLRAAYGIVEGPAVIKVQLIEPASP